MATSSADPVTAPFDAFYREHHAALVRLAHLLIGSHEIAEEVAQEALLATAGRWERLENPAGYARGALVNLCRSQQRRRALERRHVLAPPPAGLAPEIDEMWALIQRLPADQRAVLVLRFYEDLTLDEIARVLDRPSGTVKSLLHRTLARLKEGLS